MPVATFPSIEPAAVTVVPVVPLQINRTLSGRETRDLVTGPYFELTYDFAPLTVEQRKQIAGHIALANGSLQSFYIKLPTHLDDATGNATGLIDVRTATAAGATSVNYLATLATSTVVFKAGDMIQFDNHGKVYEVTTDSSTDASGQGTVDIFPPLRTSLSLAEDINYDNIPILVRYKDDISYEVRNDSFGYISIQFIEVFE